MYKRIKYISSFSESLTDQELHELAETAAKSNAANDITGILMASEGIFFQIIEGPEENIDKLFAKILKDQRHEKIITLGIQSGDFARLFPTWTMKAFNLDSGKFTRLQSVKAIIDAVHAQAVIIENLTDTLATVAWEELLEITDKGEPL